MLPKDSSRSALIGEIRGWPFLLSSLSVLRGEHEITAAETPPTASHNCQADSSPPVAPPL